MIYSMLKTIVRFMTKNPPGSRFEFSQVRDARPLERSFMTGKEGAEMRPINPSFPLIPPAPVESVFREGTDMSQVSSADYTYLDGQSGASDYFLNNINLDETTSVLYAKVNEIVTALRARTTLLDGKRITKMYATDLVYGKTKDEFYQHMTGVLPDVPLRTLVREPDGRPLVILVELEIDRGGSRRKSRRRRKSTRKSRRR